MAITWGSKVEERKANGTYLGYQIGYETSTSGDTLSITFYIRTKWSVQESRNTFSVTINDTETKYSGLPVYTYVSTGSGYSDKNICELKTVTTNASGTVTFSASMTHLELTHRPPDAGLGYNLVATVSGSALNYEAGSAPTIDKILDNKNNTFSFEYTLPGDATRNKLIGSKLQYWTTVKAAGVDITSKVVELDVPAGTNSLGPYNMPDNCIQVECKIYCNFTYGEDTYDEASASVVFYASPKITKAPEISYDKKLTVNKDCTYVWTSEAQNNNSPVKFHRIRIYKNGSEIPGLVVGTGNYLVKSIGTNIYVNRAGDSSTVIFNPKNLGFKVGDTVKLGVYAYTRDGTGNYTDGRKKYLVSSFAGSNESTFENAGIIRTKVDNNWVEGQVYVKVSGEWKEAETVNAKVNGIWQESQ